MKLTYLKQEPANSRLILIFTGWSTGPELFHEIDISGWDVAVAHDYSNPELECALPDKYVTIYLFAWSLGVAEADRSLPAGRITAAFAINGTVTPVSDNYGIPKAIYHGTADNLTPRNLQKFRRRMMPDGDSFRHYFATELSEEQCHILADELRAIASRHTDDTVMPTLKWTRAYIGADDRIFPPDNMSAAWQRVTDTAVIHTDDAHYIDIRHVISGVISDTKKVSAKFSHASDTYDSQAVAQHLIAMHLTRLVHENMPSEAGRVLEIGPGTGLLTNAWSEFVTPRHTDFVDITAVGPFDVTGEANYHLADAETWIRECDETYDMILSSSVIQWFADIPGFLCECGKHLRPGGLLAIATFAPGNLEELDALRPSPLLYPSDESLSANVAGIFDITVLEQTSMRIEFESRRQLLLHLRHTGVAGSGGKGGASISDFPRVLTYRPIYLIATRL